MVHSINSSSFPVLPSNLGDDPSNAPEYLQNDVQELEAFLAEMAKAGKTSPEDYTKAEKEQLANLLSNVQTELNAVVAGANAGNTACVDAITKNSSFMSLFGQYTLGSDGKYTTTADTYLDQFLADANTVVIPGPNGYNQDLVDITSLMTQPDFAALLTAMQNADFTS